MAGVEKPQVKAESWCLGPFPMRAKLASIHVTLTFLLQARTLLTMFANSSSGRLCSKSPWEDDAVIKEEVRPRFCKSSFAWLEQLRAKLSAQ